MASAPSEVPVLLVDDDPDCRQQTRQLLVKAGIRNPVIEAASGQEAKDHLRRACLAAGGRRGAKPGVILLDIKMPGLSGFDVLRWVKRKKAFCQTKVVMWSALEAKEDYDRARELGADGYLVKFSNPAVIGAMVRACLAHGK